MTQEHAELAAIKKELEIAKAHIEFWKSMYLGVSETNRGLEKLLSESNPKEKQTVYYHVVEIPGAPNLICSPEHYNDQATLEAARKMRE